MSTEIQLPFQKRCPKCGEVKKLDDFYQLRSSKDGYMRVCKKCHSGYSSRPDSEQKKRFGQRYRLRKKMREARISEEDINDFLDIKYPTIKSDSLKDAPAH